MGKLVFRKEERLRKENDIQELFEKGSSFYLFPFKVFVRTPDNLECSQVLISVSKRNFKRAVDRNLLKRRIREAYRTQKDVLAEHGHCHLAFVYSHKEILDSKSIHQKLQRCLIKVSQLPKP
jgi:ribonuclease P protein component